MPKKQKQKQKQKQPLDVGAVMQGARKHVEKVLTTVDLRLSQGFDAAIPVVTVQLTNAWVEGYLAGRDST